MGQGEAGMLFGQKTKDLTEQAEPAPPKSVHRTPSIFSYKSQLDHSHPSLIHFSSTPLFRLENDPGKYLHLLKKKDSEFICPIVHYLIRNSGQTAYLGGDAVKNLYLHGRKKYKKLNILTILSTTEEVDKYAGIFNNIISANDGAFSMMMRYRVSKNRCEGCYKDLAQARYLIEPRLQGCEKLLYPLRASAIELDITTEKRFTEAFGIGNHL